MPSDALSGPQRLFVDVSYTRTQKGNVGITRTVRRLLASLQQIAGEQRWSCAAVAFHASGYRLAASNAAVLDG